MALIFRSLMLVYMATSSCGGCGGCGCGHGEGG